VRPMTDTWAVVLAGGDGRRLSKMTTNRQGVVIPKQYCSLDRSSCLLQDALHRAGSVAMPARVCTVVAAQHRRWWASAVAAVNESNVFVQPRNKGTAFGMLLALLTIERRNPEATVIFLPADHYFRDEETITRALRMAGNLASTNTESTYLMGVEPASPDPELGYILPAEKTIEKPAAITGFAEKPAVEFARDLIAHGAVWNLFMFAGSVGALIDLFAEARADVVSEMREALERQASGHATALEEFYERIEMLDFSRNILEVQANRAQLIRVPQCGWTDLGTPQRVEATIRSIGVGPGVARERIGGGAPLFLGLGS